MARDPPCLLSASELRDISLTPTFVRSAKITIIHPQLRDLILPLERGRVLYPRGMTIEEQRWLPAIEDEDGTTKRGITGSTRPLLNLNFVPNCLTASSSIFACGGQHGELYICNLPQPTNPNPLTNKYTSSAPKIKPFVISTTLSGRSINNSIIIPPTWPAQWLRTSEEKKLGYLGRGSRKYEELGRYGPEGEEVLLGKTEKGQWVTRKPLSPLEDIHDEDEIMHSQDEYENDDDDVLDEDEEDDRDTEILTEEEEEDDPAEYEVARSPISDSSVATYPNTVPFLHAPRIPHLPNPASASRAAVRDTSVSSRRTASFSSARDRERERFNRHSFSSHHEGERRYGHPPIQIVTTRHDIPIPRSSSAGSSSSSIRHRGISPPNAVTSGKHRSTHYSRKATIDEPRILISNNDCTVKMFSLHPVASNNHQHHQGHSHTIERPPVSYDADAQAQPQIGSRARHSPDSNSNSRRSLPLPLPSYIPNERDDLASRPLDRLGLGAPRSSNLALTRNGTPFEWTSHTPSHNHSHSHHRQHHLTSTSAPLTLAERESWSIQRELQRVSEGLRVEHDNLRRSVENFERVVGMRVGAGAGMARREPEEEREERKLNKVGGTRFKVATNHSSLSPDLRTMVSVGDSTEVTIFEVIDGGKEFRKIAVYDAATDAGFSTAWSKDGRKFAVASQDGQVTVWDHRSSRPLAIFHTSADTSTSSSDQPSFMNDISASHLSTSPTSSNSSGGWNVVGPEGITLRDPITGTPRTGTSTSGKEAARVVKFSPEGSDRDLMVFSEENSNIHLIDAQTFHTHVVIPVPHIPSGTADPDANSKPRQGVENGTWGIAGVGFDPSGDWLYSGTERTVVEWDLRRHGSGGGGVWGLA
ncbi:uncharacterized protein I303_103617 [Kwoniella dejecticola CBS 10117]|uniref:DUF2415 domain-containing protein n=1 Tax=Kwoniella dejecticola CBS 10117 TaxID=1296121 RepID=A0AAJ8MGL5_9TREE